MKSATLFIAAFTAMLSIESASAAAAGLTVPVLKREGPSKLHYTVRANGAVQPVHGTAQGYFCQFELAQPLTLEVECNQEIKQATLRPRSRNLQPEFSGRLLRVPLAGPAKLSLEINGDLAEPLFLFADRPATNAINPKAPGVHYFKAGQVHAVGQLKLADNQTVYIERGAILDGWISAENAAHIKVLGHGILDASKYGSALALTRCRDVEIAGITSVKNGKGWVNRIFLCDQVKFSDYKDIAWGQYSDGIDLLGSKNVRIEDVFIRNEDDSIVLKTDKYGFRGNVENVLVQNAVIWHGTAGNALEIGYETSGDFIRNVEFKHLDIIRADTQEHKYNRAAISMHPAGNAAISHIRYEDIRIEAALENLLNLKLVASKKWGNGGGSISDVVFKDISLTGGPDAPSVIQGTPASKLRGIVIENLTYKGEPIRDAAAAARKKFVIEHAEVIWR